MIWHRQSDERLSEERWRERERESEREKKEIDH